MSSEDATDAILGIRRDVGVLAASCLGVQLADLAADFDDIHALVGQYFANEGDLLVSAAVAAKLKLENSEEKNN